MKRFVVLTFAFIVAHTLTAQVMVRNDFVIDQKERKIKNKGIRFITINVARLPHFNFVMSGGANGMHIDVHALRNPGQKYSYKEVAEKVHVPNGNVNGQRVPVFLLMPPPSISIPVLSQRRQRSC